MQGRLSFLHHPQQCIVEFNSSQSCRTARSRCRPEKVPGTFVSEDFRDRADDIVWRVKVGSEWVYLHLLIDEDACTDNELASLKNLAAAVFRIEHPASPEAIGVLASSWADGQSYRRLRILVISFR